MVPFAGENADFKVDGYVTLPEMTRASKNYMTLIVNGRWVKSYAANQAVLDGLHTYLPIGRFPIAVINVETDPFLTDVNVHPSKQHIRLSKEGELFELIKSSVREAVKRSIIVPDAVKREPVKRTPSEQVTIWNEFQTRKGMEGNESRTGEIEELNRKSQQSDARLCSKSKQPQTVYAPVTERHEQTVQPEKVKEEPATRFLKKRKPKKKDFHP